MSTLAQLESWFSSPRLATYTCHPSPVEFYAWNSRLSAAYFEVIGHTEVLLRNFVADALMPAASGEPWYLNPRYDFSYKSQKQIENARETLRRRHRPETPGGVVAELSLGFWRYLLSKRHAPNVWVDLCATGLPHYPHGTDRGRLADSVEQINKLRNRVAHLEPLVDLDRPTETGELDHYDARLSQVSRWIDPDAADWIASVSRVAHVRAQRP